MQNIIKNKKLFEEQIVKQLMITIVSKAIKQKIKIDNVAKFVEDTFSTLMQDITNEQ